MVIYGLMEEGNKPKAIDPIMEKKHSRERLDQIIITGIQPAIKFKTYPIEYDGGYVYVVNVEQGETAHMSLDQKRYYRRCNFTVHAMEDYEIRDLMNRSKLPRVVVRFAITKGAVHAWLFNEGEAIAIHVRCILRIPNFILRDQVKGRTEHTVDVEDIGILHAKADDVPLGAFVLTDQAQQDIYWHFNEGKVWGASLTWKVWADNSMNEGTIHIKDINVTDLNSHI